MAVQRLNLTRDQLASFLQDFEQIKQFEKLFSTVDTINTVTLDEIGISADSAFATANEALAQISGISTALDFLSLAPRDELGTISAQNADNVNITGGLISGLDAPLPVTSGGTGQTSYTNGQLLIGNTTGNTLAKAVLTAGSGISITNGAGSITIANTGGTGTVTSVGLSGGTTGLTATSDTTNPITASGTFTLGGTLAVANGGTGQTTYTDGQLLIGNTTGNTLTKATLTAGTGVSITNGAGSITINATGTGGTVTSVSVVSANGLAGTVANATTTPAITLSTSISGIVKGNGTALSAASAGTDYVAPGAYTTSGLTMTTARILGRTTASTGAAEEITIGTGLLLSSGTLSSTVAGTVTSVSGTGTVNGITLTGTVTSSGSLTLGGTLSGVSLTTQVSGTLPVANGGTGVTSSTGTVAVVLSNTPTLVTPILGAATATSVANGLGAVGTPSYTFTGDLNTGMWSPAADTLAFSEGGVEAMRITSAGDVGIGVTDPGGYRLRLDSGTSSKLRLYNSVGNGNTIDFTDQGWQSQIVGTAGNILFNAGGTTERMRIDSAGNVGIGTATPGAMVEVVAATTTDAVRITQTGTGNALVVEDSANPDATPFVITANGAVVNGNTTALTIRGVECKQQVIGSDLNGSSALNLRYVNNTGGVSYQFAKTRSTTATGNAIVASGDSIASLAFNADDGTQYVVAASILVSVDGTPGVNDMPGRIVFSTTADGASTATERLRIDSAGNLGVGATANASAILDVQSTTKGFRLPNMTTVQKNAIATPAAGLMVFDTTLAKACVYSGAAWQTITSI